MVSQEDDLLISFSFRHFLTFFQVCTCEIVFKVKRLKMGQVGPGPSSTCRAEFFWISNGPGLAGPAWYEDGLGQAIKSGPVQTSSCHVQSLQSCAIV